jgi:hypothetical protein
MSNSKRRPHRTNELLVDPELESLRRRLEADTEALSAEFSHQLANPYVARQAAMFIAQLVSPRIMPGRPRRADVTEALRLESQGVVRSVIYSRLGKSTQQEKHALVQAMRQRKRRMRSKRDGSAAVV